MRHTSHRVPGKNYRSFGGEPLFYHVVRALLACDEVDAVVIDTDSPVIREHARKDFPGIHLLERPEHLRDDTTPMNDVLLHTTEQFPSDLYLQTHSTTPFLRASHFAAAISVMRNQYPIYDSLFGVTRLQTRLWDQLARPVNHNDAILLRTQDLPPIYQENSTLYLFGRDTLVARHNRIGFRPYLFEIDARDAWDIDDEAGFQIAEMMLPIMRQRESDTGG
jgi:CMP-N-acetylneuraminic acid synthetase